jgi:flagellar biosynthesis/type III secretory pathway protein FliH
MSSPRARVVKGDAAARAEPWLAPGGSPAQRKRAAREQIEGRLEAERLVQEAQAKAEALIAQARKDAEALSEQAVRDARQDADATLSARWLALRRAEGEAFSRDADRVVAVAVLLAERLLGAALELSPPRIADLARAVLDEARGARRATVEAHPLDAEALRSHLSTAGLEVHAVEVRESEALARGELLLHTDLGTIDAKLAPRLDRLAEALRDALR